MKREKPHCAAITKAGKPCGAAPTATGLCFFHANPNKASELGRIGGMQNHSRRIVLPSAMSKLDSGSTASARLDALYVDVLTGVIPPQKALVLIKLTDLQSKIKEQTVVENLEKKIDRLKDLIKVRDADAGAAENESPQKCETDDGCLP